MDKTFGVDVSKWNRVNWPALSQSGAKFAFIKASEMAEDVKWMENMQLSKLTGMVRTGYHFFRPAEDPIAQAQLFRSCANKAKVAGYGADMPLAVDLEWRDGTAGFEFNRRLKKFIDELAEPNLIFYTSPGYWNEVAQPVPSWAKSYPLWVANWNVINPMLPAGWNTWVFWQYKVAKLTGINLDHDWFNGTYDQLTEFAGGVPYAPPVLDTGKMMVASWIRWLTVRNGPGRNFKAVRYLKGKEIVDVSKTLGTTDTYGKFGTWAQIGNNEWLAAIYDGTTYLVNAV